MNAYKSKKEFIIVYQHNICRYEIKSNIATVALQLHREENFPIHKYKYSVFMKFNVLQIINISMLSNSGAQLLYDLGCRS